MEILVSQATVIHGLYNDCMVNVLVDDKTPPVCETPPNLYWYCDNVTGRVDRFGDRLEYSYLSCTDDAYATDNYKDFTCVDGKGNPYNEVELNVEKTMVT